MSMTQPPTLRKGGRSEIEIDVILDGLDQSQIKAIQLADGWHNVQGCELVQFAVGRSHSPLTPSKTWTYFRYTNEYGMLTFSPAGAILSISTDPFSKVVGTPQRQS